MKILVIVDGYAPEYTGGISKSVETEVAELQARGHEVKVLTRRHFRQSPGEDTQYGVPVIRHKAPLPGNKLYYLHPLLTMQSLPRLLKSIRREWPFDVAYVHNTFHANAVSRSRLPVKKVFRFHAPAPAEIAIDVSSRKYGPASKAVKPLISLVTRAERRAILGMDLTITATKFMTRQLREHHPKFKGMVKTVPLMVDTERFSFAECTEPFKSKIGVPQDRLVLLTIRRLVGRMGLMELVEAMKSVSKEHPDALLLIGGKGYLEKALRSRIEEMDLGDSVRLLGFVSEDVLADCYRASDLFVLPSAHLEGFGLVSLEAMSCGTPVLATNVGGNPEVIGGFDEGMLLKDASSKSIANGILAAIDKAKKGSLRSEVRAYCVKNFSRKAVGDSLEKELLAGTS